MRSQIELMAGEANEAARLLRENCDFFASVGHRLLLATGAGELAEALYRSGRADEAEEWTRVAEAHASPADLSAQFQWRGVRGKVLAHAGRAEDAEALAREAVTLVERTDAVNQHAGLLLDLAEVLQVHRNRRSGRASRRSAGALPRKGESRRRQAGRGFLDGAERYASNAEGP